MTFRELMIWVSFKNYTSDVRGDKSVFVMQKLFVTLKPAVPKTIFEDILVKCIWSIHKHKV